MTASFLWFLVTRVKALFNKTRTFLMFSACFVYFHEGDRWKIGGGVKCTNFPGSLSLVITPIHRRFDLIFIR